VFLGAFSMLYVPGEGPALDMVREHIVEVIAVHMILECIFNGFLHKLINREGAKHMTWDMWVHHVGSIFGALFCKVVSTFIYVDSRLLKFIYVCSHFFGDVHVLVISRSPHICHGHILLVSLLAKFLCWTCWAKLDPPISDAS
jgi:hypothetical protein